jgi:hypothetical protein
MNKQLAADLYRTAFEAMVAESMLLRTVHHQGDTLAINPAALQVDTDLAFLTTEGNKRRLAVPAADADDLRNMPCLMRWAALPQRCFDCRGLRARRFIREVCVVIAGTHRSAGAAGA